MMSWSIPERLTLIGGIQHNHSSWSSGKPEARPELLVVLQNFKHRMKWNFTKPIGLVKRKIYYFFVSVF